MDGNFIFNMKTTNDSKIETIRNNREYKLITPNKQYIIKYKRNSMIDDPYDADDEKDSSKTSSIENFAKRLANSPKIKSRE